MVAGPSPTRATGEVLGRVVTIPLLGTCDVVRGGLRQRGEHRGDRGGPRRRRHAPPREGRRSWAGRHGRPRHVLRLLDARAASRGRSSAASPTRWSGVCERSGPVVKRPNTYGAGAGITYHAGTPQGRVGATWSRPGRGARAPPRVRPGRDGPRRPGHDVVVATKAGLGRVAARIVIDASGDADLCAFAGFGFEQAGEREPAQTLTTTFRMVNVDQERATVDHEGRAPRPDAPGRRRGLRPAPARGQRPHDAHRRRGRHRR